MIFTTPEILLSKAEETNDLLYKLTAAGTLSEVREHLSREQRERLRDVCHEVSRRLTTKVEKHPYS